LLWKASEYRFIGPEIDKQILAIGGKCKDWIIRKRRDYLINKVIVASKGLRALNKGEL